MNHLKILPTSLILLAFTTTDIAPNPIEANGIYPSKECKIRMESERVVNDLYPERAKVNCTFEMVNYGPETEIEVGFPVMEFQYWSTGGYTETDKDNFKISVDGRQLDEQEIKAPKEADSLYKAYMEVYETERLFAKKQDSVYASHHVTYRKNGSLKFPEGSNPRAIHDEIMGLYNWRDTQPKMTGDLIVAFMEQVGKGKFPWYVWKVKFGEGEHKTIKVSYELPSGLSYGGQYRYFKYILNTGAGWYKDIGHAEIVLHLHGIDFGKIERYSPSNYIVDKERKTIKWDFRNIEPTTGDDVYLQYYVPKERKAFEREYGRQ
jgi:hypothetical protein